MIDTTISFLIQFLENIQNEYIVDLVKIIKKSHIEYKKSNDPNKLNEFVSYLANSTNSTISQKYKDGVTNISDKLYEIFQQIILYMRNKSVILLEIIVVKFLEFYLIFLKYKVKDYLRFSELNTLINFLNKCILNGENYSNEIINNLYDDPIVNFIVGLFLTSDFKSSSFVNLVDSLLIGSNNKEENKTPSLSEFELLKIKKLEKISKLQNISELNQTSGKGSVSSPPTVKSHNISIVLTPEIGHFVKEESSFQLNTIVKSCVESKKDKIKIILCKYGNSKKSSYDKSPPLTSVNEDIDSIILSRRRSPSMKF